MKVVFPKSPTIEPIEEFVEISLHMLFATLMIYTNRIELGLKFLMGIPSVFVFIARY